MKKIITILLIALCSTALVAQNEISSDEIKDKLNLLLEQINDSANKKEYKKSEKLCIEGIAFISGLSEEIQKDLENYNGAFHYNLACVLSLQKKTKAAIDAFEKAIGLNYINYHHFLKDTDLDNLRKDKRFQKIMDTLREKYDYAFIISKAGKYQKEDTAGLPKFKYEEAKSFNLPWVKYYFKLDSIAGNGDEISKIINLMTWVHDNIRHDGSNYPLCEFDAIDIYNYHKSTGKGVNCRMLAITLNEFYLAMGFKSRYVSCLPENIYSQDCHVINCVYSNTLQKWLWMDPTINAYWKDENGNLLSIEEVRERYINYLPLVLNDDANWNNENKNNRAIYLDNWMGELLFIFQCNDNSRFNPESRYRTMNNTLIYLCPAGHPATSRNAFEVITHDADYFWER